MDIVRAHCDIVHTDRVGSEPDQTDSWGPQTSKRELMRVLSKAVQELELTWRPPEEPARSSLTPGISVHTES